MNVSISKALLICFIFIGIISSSSCSSSKKSSNRDYYSYKKTQKRKKSRTKKITQTKKKAKRKTNTNRTTSKQRNAIIVEAQKYKGIPYVYGGKTPKGFDCSGFTSYIFHKKGVKLKGSSRDQATLGKKISLKSVKPGDLLFFGNEKRVSHVGVISKVGPELIEIIHSTKSRGVVQENIYNSKYWQKRFLFARDILSFSS